MMASLIYRVMGKFDIDITKDGPLLAMDSKLRLLRCVRVKSLIFFLRSMFQVSAIFGSLQKLLVGRQIVNGVMVSPRSR